MRMTDAVVGPPQPGLEVSEHPVDSREDSARHSGIGALDACSVAIAHRPKGVVASEAIGEHDRAGRDVRRDKSDQGPRRDVSDHLQANASRGSASDFHRAHNDSLVNDLPSATQASFRPSDIGLIDLDPVLEELPVGVHHRAAELVQHRPCCLVAAQPQLPLELQGREAGRLCRDQVGGPEPLRKRLPGSVQDGARGNRGFVPASLASPKQPRRQLEGFDVSAARTAEPLRPTAPRQVLATRLFVAEELPKLVQRPRILPGARPTLSLGVGGVNRISRSQLNSVLCGPCWGDRRRGRSDSIAA